MDTISYLSTAFIGSVFGCAVSYLIYRESNFRTAKFELIEHVRLMIHDIRFNKSGESIFRMFNNNIVTLHIRYLKLRAAYILPCNGCHIDTAWCHLIERDENKSKEPGVESMNLPIHGEDAVKRLSNFLKEIESV